MFEELRTVYTIGQRHAKKGPLNITHSVDPDQPLINVYTLKLLTQQEIYVLLIWWVSKSADPDQTLRQRRSGWSGSTLFAYFWRSLFAWSWPIEFCKLYTFNSLSSLKEQVKFKTPSIFLFIIALIWSFILLFTSFNIIYFDFLHSIVCNLVG